MRGFFPKIKIFLIIKITEPGSNGSAKTVTLGNTKPRSNAAKCWCFTWNHYPDGSVALLDRVFKEYGCMCIIGAEKGSLNSTPHLQGYCQRENKFRPIELLKLPKEIHWEVAKGNLTQNIDYCSKEGIIVLDTIPIKLKKKKKMELKLINVDQLFDWQKDIIKIISNEPDDRKIYWFWEPRGKSGKTQFCKFLSYHYDAIPLEGKKNDILFCAAEHESNIYIWDLERSMEDYVSYGALEKIKNGYFMCSKYESKPIIRNSPHVIVMANFQPEIEKLSLDRWLIKRI